MSYPRPTIRHRIARLLFTRYESEIIASAIRKTQMEFAADFTNKGMTQERLWSTFKTKPR